ncbi:MAG TPA: Fe-S cluster assembly protein SufD [Candidatus Saccharimonadales bacterium]|nr:Fe-S cluster assembly protein SufD [Candidatus Saccharimonadales bacterium]
MDKDLYIAAFRESQASGDGGADWLAPVRSAAIETFGDLGFPTTRQEEWKYTSLKPIAGATFRAAGPYRPNGLSIETLRGRALACGGGPVLTFVDGMFAPDLSRREPLQAGLKLLRLSEALADHRDEIEPWLTKLSPADGRPLVALNTAFLADGACMIIPAGMAVENPVQVVFLSSASEKAPVVSHPRLLVVAGKRSQVTIVETYAGAGPGGGFTNAVTEIAAGDGAVVEHYKVQRESPRGFHVASIQARLGRDASYTAHSLSDGAALTRNDVGVTMTAQGGDCTLNGLYVVSGKQHVDNHTVIEHEKPFCTSRELYKGVLGGAARGVFDGKIIVRPDAQKTDARQVNSNLLLSDAALVDTKPQLEINADDVKCSHAATIGQLDPDSIFYLRSRGLDQHEARNLLVHGFVHEMINRIKIGCLRTGLEGLLFGRLDREARQEIAS